MVRTFWCCIYTRNMLCTCSPQFNDENFSHKKKNQPYWNSCSMIPSRNPPCHTTLQSGFLSIPPILWSDFSNLFFKCTIFNYQRLLCNWTVHYRKWSSTLRKRSDSRPTLHMFPFWDTNHRICLWLSLARTGSLWWNGWGNWVKTL